MDPAEAERIRAALATQGAMLVQQQRNQETMLAEIRQLTHALTNLAANPTPSTGAPAAAMAVPPGPPVATREPRLPPPERYDGRPEGCREFLTQCSLVFSLQPLTFPTEQSRVAYIITLLSGRALSWATAEWESQSPACSDANAFTRELRKIFDTSRVISGHETGRRLAACRQGDRSVADYSIHFRTLAMEAGWEEKALVVLYAQGLSESMKDELALRELPESLDGIVELSVRVDNRRRERSHERASTHDAPSQLPSMREPIRWSPEETTGEEAMQLGAAQLSSVERRRRLDERRCFRCGRKGHRYAACPGGSGNGATH